MRQRRKRKVESPEGGSKSSALAGQCGQRRGPGPKSEKQPKNSCMGERGQGAVERTGRGEKQSRGRAWAAGEKRSLTSPSVKLCNPMTSARPLWPTLDPTPSCAPCPLSLPNSPSSQASPCVSH